MHVLQMSRTRPEICSLLFIIFHIKIFYIFKSLKEGKEETSVYTFDTTYVYMQHLNYNVLQPWAASTNEKGSQSPETVIYT